MVKFLSQPTLKASVWSGLVLLTVWPILGVGCIESQLRRRMVPESKEQTDVLRAAEATLRERYYQVKVYKTSSHVVALSPIKLEGNSPVRKKIDVYVFQENGFWMPKVWVRKYIDVAEPELERGSAITGRFPTEVMGYPAATEDWQPLIYDRTEEEELRNAILDRLKIPS